MDTADMDMREEWLETILQRDAQRRGVARVLGLTSDSVVEKGDNYASDICRITMDVVLGSGEVTKRTLIAKTIPKTEMRAKHLTEWGIFKKEIKMFDEVLPKMEKLLEEFDDRSEPLWGRCIYSRPNDLLLLEDLKMLGYKMADRQEGMDMHHAKLVLRSMAKFHAMSVVIHSRGELEASEFSKSIFTSNRENMTAFLDQVYEKFASVIETTWEPQWKIYADKVRALIGTSLDHLDKMFDSATNKFNVLNHGDSWVNNVMFKYDGLDSEAATTMRYVDFQLSYYNSYAYDLHYFLTSSIKNEFRANNYRDFLAYYQENLTDFLGRFGYSGERPSLADVESEFDRTYLFSFMMGVILVPLVLLDREEAPDMEELLKKWEKADDRSVDVKPYLGKRFTAAMKLIIAECDRAGVFEKLGTSL